MVTTPLPPAPFGYTKAGKSRKRAQFKEGICPIKNCKKSFRHRKNPKQAVWQHLLYFCRPEIASPNEPLAVAHRALHVERKTEISQHPSVTGKYYNSCDLIYNLTNIIFRRREKRASEASLHRFAEKIPEKRKRAAALASLKVKAQRHLIRDGKGVNKEVVNQMANKWMEEREK